MEKIELIREIIQKIDIADYSAKYPLSKSLKGALKLKEAVLNCEVEEEILDNARKLKNALRGAHYSPNISDENLKEQFLVWWKELRELVPVWEEVKK